MAFDEQLAARVRSILDHHPKVTEKKMFGGLAFMVRGHMCVGVEKDRLMVRVGPTAYPALLQDPHAREMDFTGKPLKGYLYVNSKGLSTETALNRWIEHGLALVGTLPEKTPKPRRGRSAG
jgi:TfoX/Sxy family transcriptional regulator of competence genes